MWSFHKWGDLLITENMLQLLLSKPFVPKELFLRAVVPQFVSVQLVQITPITMVD